MKTSLTFLTSSALLLAAGICPVVAQTPGTTDKPAGSHPMPGAADGNMASHSASTSMAPLTPARASNIIGTSIENSTGEEIAEIKDLVVCKSGKVIAIVEVDSRDGAMVGVPLDRLEARCDNDEREAQAKDKDQPATAGAATPDIQKFVLSGSTTLFDAAPVLKDDKSVDQAWLRSCEEHYAAGASASNPKAGMDGMDKERKGADKTGGDMLASGLQPACAKTLIGEDVTGSNGDDIGDVKDLAVDLLTSEVAYAIVSTGGVLGMGDSLHAIPFERLTINAKEVVIPMTKDAVAQLPKLDLDRLPSLTASTTAPPRSKLANERDADRKDG